MAPSAIAVIAALSGVRSTGHARASIVKFGRVGIDRMRPKVCLGFNFSAAISRSLYDERIRRRRESTRNHDRRRCGRRCERGKRNRLHLLNGHNGKTEDESLCAREREREQTDGQRHTCKQTHQHTNRNQLAVFLA